MTVLLDFPRPNASLKIRNVAVSPFYPTRPGQEATNGMRRAGGMAGAVWRMKFDVLVTDQASARTMRAFFFRMEADTALVRLRIPDYYGIDGPFADATKSVREEHAGGIPFATGAMYATGAGHAVPTRETVLVEDADASAREIYVAMPNLPGGCAISINEFCYGIAGSWSEPGDINRLRLSPVLRQDLKAGQVISLAPVFVGVCMTTSPGYDALVLGRFGTHSLEFVEDLTRLGDID
ncbi:hypothetical protein [Rhizobium sp. Leaf386]|uniref:hypothetical protein n=1 Tax=Rhizobium sp. Leaf386 TaxID=1736359 RepID=UPI0007142BB0|nr:hypothetical protein [Rhizobium sp. Leaf386]KQS90298.1 hypothetical protein ASG50_07525 [Rhizobium sp. Leaf386]